MIQVCVGEKNGIDFFYAVGQFLEKWLGQKRFDIIAELERKGKAEIKENARSVAGNLYAAAPDLLRASMN